MEIRQEAHNQSFYRSKRYDEYFKELKVLVIDIETTGLYPNSSKVILGGVLDLTESGLGIRQYFLEQGDDEKDLLVEYVSQLKEADVLITYNGNGFDLPFLKHRLAHHAIRIDFDHCQSFDLYRALHHYSNFRSILPNLKQKTIETYLGLSVDRQDEISGQESVALYQGYLADGSLDKKEKILLHNHDDLVQLATILQIIDKLDLHKVLFHEGFTVFLEEKRAFVQHCAINKKTLSVTALTRNLPTDYYSFEIGYQAIHRAETKELSLDIPLEEEHGALILDLEAMPIDFSSIKELPHHQHGYLIIKEANEIHYQETNSLVKLILKDVLSHF